MKEFELSLAMVPPSANARLVPLLIKGRARLVKAKADRVFQEAMRETFEAKYPGAFPFLGPVRIEIHMSLRMVTADVSNRIKTVEDALTELAYVDDCQVAEVRAFKRIDENEGCRVRVVAIDEEAQPLFAERLAKTKKMQEASAFATAIEER